MGMLCGNGEIEAIGLKILGPDPLGESYFPLGNPMSILYGKNGAGKSRYLDAIASLLEGTNVVTTPRQTRPGLPELFAEDQGYVLVRVTAKGCHKDDLLGNSILMGLGAGLPGYRDASGTQDFAFDTWDREIAAYVEARYSALWASLDHGAVMAQELATHLLLALTPEGLDGHQWAMYAAVIPSPETPMIRGHLSRLERELEDLWGLDLDEEDRISGVRELLADFQLSELELSMVLNWSRLRRRPGLTIDCPGTGEVLVVGNLGTFTIDQTIADLLSGIQPPRGKRALTQIYGQPSGQLAERTLGMLRDHSLRHNLAILRPGSDALSEELTRILDTVGRAATYYYSFLMEDPVSIECRVAAPSRWLFGESLTWVVQNQRGVEHDITALSRAQYRWAELCVSAALSRVFANAESGRGLLIIDEPELALHTRATQHMANGLREFAKVLNVDVVLATHSNVLLDAPDARLLHVVRDDTGVARLEGMPALNQGSLEELGLTKAELLQAIRKFLVVEGAHDEAFFDVVLADEIRASRTHIFPLRGGKNAAALLDAQFLVSFTEAEFIVVLDNIDPGHAANIWAEVNRMWSVEPDVDAVRGYLKEQLPGSVSSEYGYLRELAVAALASGQFSRVKIRPVALPDIICYLPPSAFGATGKGWEELQAEHVTSSTNLSFKEWLRRQKKFVIDIETIAAGASRLDSMHPDLVSLAQELVGPLRPNPLDA